MCNLKQACFSKLSKERHLNNFSRQNDFFLKLWIKRVKILFWSITQELLDLRKFWTINLKMHVLFFQKGVDNVEIEHKTCWYWLYLIICCSSTAMVPCYSSPCQNDGLCVNNADSYTCMCADGFTGLDCSEGEWWHVCTKGFVLSAGLSFCLFAYLYVNV